MSEREEPRSRKVTTLLVAMAIATGGFLVVDNLLQSSATYDEVAYLRVAATWWRTGAAEEIARMGSPLTFFKLQQAPVLWMLDRAGFGALIDDPLAHQAALLPLMRLGSLWIWVVALGLTAYWARRAHGARAMVFAVWLFALSPNLIAHGALVTMEMPLVAGSAGMFVLWTRFLESGLKRWFLATAALAGLVVSLKFTAILLPPLFGLSWWFERGRSERLYNLRLFARIAAGMFGFLAVMALANVVVTGGARIPISEQTGSHPAFEQRLGTRGAALVRILIETPIPQDWAGFARQMEHQRSGGPSYLMGERRMHGWWYYYFICLAIKVPVSFWLLVVGRLCLRRANGPGDRLALTVIVGTLVIVALGSSRNYGYRYLLFLAPAAIVWLSALAENGRWARRLAVVGLIGQALAVATTHPHELSYFPRWVGGPEGGKFLLSDSNLDWGQGLKALARLQARRPELRDATVFSFGEADPARYGVAGTCIELDAHDRTPLPPRLTVTTPFVAVSRSLQYGPWGPAHYFRMLDVIQPVAITDDHTIAVYRWPGLDGSR